MKEQARTQSRASRRYLGRLETTPVKGKRFVTERDSELQFSDSYRDTAAKLRCKIILFPFWREYASQDYESKLTRSRFSAKSWTKCLIRTASELQEYIQLLHQWRNIKRFRSRKTETTNDIRRNNFQKALKRLKNQKVPLQSVLSFPTMFFGNEIKSHHELLVNSYFFVLQLIRANKVPCIGKDSNETLDEILDYYYIIAVLRYCVRLVNTYIK